VVFRNFRVLTAHVRAEMSYGRVTMPLMDKTLTIRLDASQDRALTRRAEATGKTRSQLVREMIAQGLEEQPLGRRIGHLKGKLNVPLPKSGWKRHIKERNWR
jgi:hypothetical protein